MTVIRTRDYPSGDQHQHRSQAALTRWLNQTRPGVIWTDTLGGIWDRTIYGANLPGCECHKEAA
jgi:hypothetical protein